MRLKTPLPGAHLRTGRPAPGSRRSGFPPPPPPPPPRSRLPVSPAPVRASYLLLEAELQLPAQGLSHGATWSFAFGAQGVSTIHYVGDEV